MLGRGAFSLHFGSSTGAQGAGQALRPLPTLSLSQRRVQLRAEPGDKQPNDADLQKKFFSSPGDGQQDRPGAQQGPGSSTSSSGGGGGGQAQPNLLDNVNPYELGRQARRAFDDVWGSISSITSPTKSYVFDDILDPTLSLEEYAGDSNARTTVLVVGATGRVGRILIRKLLLRGYKVRALIRKRQGLREKPDDVPGLPSAVEVVSGDVGELADCQKAIKGVDKVRARGRARGRGEGECCGGGSMWCQGRAGQCAAVLAVCVASLCVSGQHHVIARRRPACREVDLGMAAAAVRARMRAAAAAVSAP
jgi:hypothetical protein